MGIEGTPCDGCRFVKGGSGLSRFALNDAAGIFCTFVCDECEREAMAEFRIEIFQDPNYETDEPKEPEESLPSMEDIRNHLAEGYSAPLAVLNPNATWDEPDVTIQNVKNSPQGAYTLREVVKILNDMSQDMYYSGVQDDDIDQITRTTILRSIATWLGQIQ